MVLLDSHRRVLLVPDEEDNTEYIPIGLLLLVLLSGRHQDDRAAHHPDAGILDAWQGYLSLYRT